VMDYFQPATPVIIRMLASIISAANEAGKPVSICGELASDSNWTRLLLGLGLREFSINPPSFNEIKRVLGEADIEDCEELAANVLECRLRSETEKLLVKFQNNSILRGEPQLES
jgi:phosphotransferase system enzyme I (PtsI)